MTPVQLVHALENAGLSEVDATAQAANFFKDFDTLSTGALPIKLFLDQYKILMTLNVVNDILANSTGHVDINQEQLGKILSTKLEGEASAAQTRQMFHTLDEDGNGSISEAELRAWKITAEESITAARDSFNLEVVRDMYDKFDLDGSGSLEPEEVRHMIAELGEVLTNEQFENVIQIIDVDKSGEVDFEEFSGWFLNRDRVPGGAQGAIAAGLRARLMVTRGQNWLSTVVAKGNSKGGLTASVSLDEFKETRAVVAVSFEEKHLGGGLAQWAEDDDRILLYVSFDWKVHHEQSAAYLERLLDPIIKFPKYTREKLPFKLKITRPSATLLRLSLGIKSRALSQLPIEEVKHVLTGANAQFETAYDVDFLANNFHSMTLGDLIKLRARVHLKDVPSELLVPLRSTEAKEKVDFMASKLHMERVPIASDLLEGKTGALEAELHDTMLTLINELAPAAYEELKQSATRAGGRHGGKPEGATRVTIQASNGKYLNSRWELQSEEAFLYTKDVQDRGMSLFETSGGHGDVAPGAKKYRLVHNNTGKTPVFTGNNPWRPGDSSSVVFGYENKRLSDKYLTLEVPNSNPKLYASRGGRHWNLSTNPYYFKVTYDENHQAHIRAHNSEQFMRHYNGDSDNFTQSTMDRDTAWLVTNEPDGTTSFKNPSRDRWLGAESETESGVLQVPERKSYWVATEIAKAEVPVARAPVGACILEHVETGQYAGRGGRHWCMTDEPQLMCIQRGDDGKFHITDAKGSGYMRHYSGDSDVFTQSYTDRDTAWEIRTTDGKEVNELDFDEKVVVFHNPLRANAQLAPSYAVLEGRQSPGTSGEWRVSMHPDLSQFRGLDEEKISELRVFHFRNEAGVYMRHYSADSDVFQQSYQDSDTKWEVQYLEGQHNQVRLKSPTTDRFLCVDDEEDKFYCPNLAAVDEPGDLVFTLEELKDTDSLDEDTSGSENDSSYVCVWSEGQYLMHHSGRSQVSNQDYIDVDVINKVQTVSGKSKFQRSGGRFMTVNSSGTCIEYETERNSAAVESQEFTVTAVPEVVSTRDQKQDDVKQLPFLDRPVADFLKELITLNPLPQRDIEEMFKISSAVKSALLIASRDVAELQAVHVRRQDGNGATMNIRGLCRPAGLLKLITEFFDVILP